LVAVEEELEVVVQSFHSFDRVVVVEAVAELRVESPSGIEALSQAGVVVVVSRMALERMDHQVYLDTFVRIGKVVVRRAFETVLRMVHQETLMHWESYPS
jgi:HD superfamily phosphohydrolase